MLYPSILLSKKLIMHLFPYSSFNLSTSRLPPLNKKRLKLYSITFCSQPNCYGIFRVLLFSYCFFPTTSTVVFETISAQTGVSSNTIISAGWYEYFICDFLTRNICETIFAIKRSGSFYATDVFLCIDKIKKPSIAGVKLFFIAIWIDKFQISIYYSCFVPDKFSRYTKHLRKAFKNPF